MAGIAVFVVLYVTAIGTPPRLGFPKDARLAVVTKDIFGQEGVHFGVFVFLSGICMLSVNLWSVLLSSFSHVYKHPDRTTELRVTLTGRIQRWFRRIANEKQPTPEERKEAVEKMLDEAVLSPSLHPPQPLTTRPRAIQGTRQSPKEAGKPRPQVAQASQRARARTARSLAGRQRSRKAFCPRTSLQQAHAQPTSAISGAQ